MDDLIAVRVDVDVGQPGFFLTWGRVIDAVDPGPIAHVVLGNAGRFALVGQPVSAGVCGSLTEASGCDRFHEAFAAMCRQPIPFGTRYAEWRREKLERQMSGRDLWFVGHSSPRHTLLRIHARVGDGDEQPVFEHGPPPDFTDFTPPSGIVPWASDELKCHSWYWDGAQWVSDPDHATREDCRHRGQDQAGLHHFLCPTCGWTFEAELVDADSDGGSR